LAEGGKARRNSRDLVADAGAQRRRQAGFNPAIALADKEATKADPLPDLN
jgi:hypothetical protein